MGSKGSQAHIEVNELIPHSTLLGWKASYSAEFVIRDFGCIGNEMELGKASDRESVCSASAAIEILYLTNPRAFADA